MAYLLTLEVKTYVRDHNSFSWAGSSAAHNCPVKSFEVETRATHLGLMGNLMQGSPRNMCSLYGFIYLGATKCCRVSLAHSHSLPLENGFS